MRRWRELATVVLAFAILTIALLAPLAVHVGSVARLDNADARYIIWNVAWVARTLVADPVHVFDANIFYPRLGTLAYSETNLGAGALAIPVYWATGNPVAAHNVVLLLSFVLSATGTYYLVRYLVGHRGAAVVSAVCFAYCPYVLSHLPHLHLLMTAGVPFSLLAFHRLADDPRPGRGLVLGAVMGLQVVFCGYYGVFAVLVVGWAVLATAALQRRTDARYWTAVAAAAGVAAAIALPLFVPYLRLQQTAGFRSSTFDEARLFSATGRTYFASSAYAHRWMLPLIGRWNEVLFPGFVALAAGAVGLALWWRSGGRGRQLSVLYGGLALLAFWASLGPDAGLYALLHVTVPAFKLMRAPSRFGMLVTFALSVAAAVPMAGALRRLPRAAAAGAVLIAALELATPLSFSAVPPIDPVYRALAALPPGPVIELPVYSSRFATNRTWYMLGSTVHWMPLVNAYSSYIPEDFKAQLDTLGAFPTRESLDLLRREGVRYAIFHLDQFSADARDEIGAKLEEFRGTLLPRYTDDRATLYEIVERPW